MPYLVLGDKYARAITTCAQAQPVLFPLAQEVQIPFTAPSPADAGYDDIFRRAHGTDYDPSSPVDRRKMETIKHARLDTAEPAATRTF